MKTELSETMERRGYEVLRHWTDDDGTQHARVEREARRYLAHMDPCDDAVHLSHSDEYCETCRSR